MTHEFQVMGQGTPLRPYYLRCKRCKHECGLLGTIIPCNPSHPTPIAEGVYKR